MEVEIISREIIKPPIPLNNDFKTFQVSILDILSRDSSTPIIFFYSMINTDEEQYDPHNAISKLKLSLSQTLARFPMLAGKFKQGSIHCSNEEDVGALFVETKVKIHMAEFLKTPNLQLLEKFLPPLIPNQPLEKAFQIAVQVNLFECGGIAIGGSFLHKVIDGTTMSVFLRSWAASCEGKIGELSCGNFSWGSSLFPRREIWDGYNQYSPFLVKKGKSSTARRFVFDAMAIANLKAGAKSTSVPNPTSVEVVTCCIWKYVMKASRLCTSSSDKKEFIASGQEPKWGSTLVHTVNLRRRIQPPLSENEVGNIIWRSPAYYEASNSETQLADLENVLRQSLSKINNDFIQKITGDDGFENFRSSLQQLHELQAKSCETFLFTSWRNMGFNEINFGWGKPIWVACGINIFESHAKNVVVLMDTTTGDGMEVWALLDGETMNLLENDHEFLEFASLNPSVTLT